MCVHLEIVGIHCTHGVNRTGYLVARYMIEWLGYQPKDAIEGMFFLNVSGVQLIKREIYDSGIQEPLGNISLTNS